LLFLFTGCSTLGYYAQSIAGQYQLLSQREPISELLQDPSTPPALKQKLRTVLEIRDYASNALALPDNGSYRTYVDLKRPYVVWNVFAAPEFSFELKEWCFPFAGCVRYRGYFHEADARKYAAMLQKQSLDVYVGGVPAYSTLGWFNDPLLSTIIKYDDAHLAGLIFHELAHQQLYVKGDTAFNEGFATTVETEGVKRWLAQQGNAQLDKQYQQQKARYKEFVALVTQTRDRLEKLYHASLTPQAMREGKHQIQQQMRDRYQQLKQQWQGYSGYDHWFSGPLNNAQLASVTTYEDYVPAFRHLLQREHGDFSAFYKAAADIGALPPAKREKALRDLLPKQ
jgi:predicted aminopeptidase